MKRKLGLAAVAIGSILTIAAPQTALANDHDRDYRDRGYYSYGDSRGYMTPHERREYEKRLKRERKEQERAWRREQNRYRNGYYNGYRNGYSNGYYDQYGSWHGYR